MTEREMYPTSNQSVTTGNVAGRAIAIGSNASVTVTNIYQWVREQPAEPQTLEAAQLLLADIPVDLVPETAPLADGSRMPHPANPLFVGRTAELQQLAAALRGDPNGIGTSAVITGLGGIGKTNLATEWVHRYGAFFAGGVFWLAFDRPDAIPLEIAACGGAAGLNLRPDFAELPLPEQVAFVQRAWNSSIPRLLVFDGCDSDDAEQLIQQYRPASGGCRVLVTSRRTRWDASLGLAECDLEVFSREQSVQLLLAFRDSAPQAELTTLAEALGDLPLALHLAGSYLKLFPELDVASYLSELNAETLLQHESLQGVDLNVSPTNHPLHIGRTFALSYDRLADDDPLAGLARQLLSRAAWLQPGVPIPRSLLIATAQLEPGSESRKAERAIRRLEELGLLVAETDGHLLLQRLLAQFIHQANPDPQAQTATETALFVYLTEELEDIPEYWSAVLPHLQMVVDRALPRHDEIAIRLLVCLGNGLGLLADYPKATATQEQALALAEQYFGADHAVTILAVEGLALIQNMLGAYQTVYDLLKRVLAYHEQQRGPEAPETIRVLGFVASILIDLGQYQEARTLFDRALALAEKVYGAEDDETATIQNNAAYLLWSLDDLAGARLLYEKSLATTEKLFGPEHPETMTLLNNLALVLESLGDTTTARQYYQRALDVRVKLFGPNHPITAQSYHNLACFQSSVGEYETAYPLFQHALTIYQQVFGAEHYEVGNTMYHIGKLYLQQQKTEQGLVLLRQAFAIHVGCFGEDHPDTKTYREELAQLEQASKAAA